MKVLHISGYYHPHIGGIEQTANDCVDAFADRCEQRVVCFNHEKGDVVDRVDGVEVIRAGCFAKVASQQLSFSFGKLLKKTLREFQPDIVIFHYPNPLAAHFLLKQLKRYPVCKLVVWWHLDITKQKILGKLFRGQNKRILRRADKIVATSPNYIDGSPYLSTVREKCVVIPSCVGKSRVGSDDDLLSKAMELRKQNEGKTICFAIGRHVPYKGLEYLVRASKLLDEQYVIWIGGAGPLTEELKQLASGDRKVIFLGQLSDKDVKVHMLACDIFCFPSITKNEAFGLALAEAMAYGKPSVTFTIEGSGVNYVSLNGVTGIEVANRDVEAYAEAIKKLADDPTLRKTYGEAAKAREEELFSIAKFREKVLHMIESL